jgi:hypothetical protein
MRRQQTCVAQRTFTIAKPVFSVAPSVLRRSLEDDILRIPNFYARRKEFACIAARASNVWLRLCRAVEGTLGRNPCNRCPALRPPPSVGSG